MPEIETLLTCSMVAQALGVNRWTVANWCKAGRFPHAQQVGAGRNWMIPASDLETFERPHWGWEKGRKRKPSE